MLSTHPALEMLVYSKKSKEKGLKQHINLIQPAPT